MEKGISQPLQVLPLLICAPTILKNHCRHTELPPCSATELSQLWEGKGRKQCLVAA